MTLTHSVLQRGSEGADAITNHGVVVANGVSLEGFAPPDGAATPLVGVLQGRTGNRVTRLPISPSSTRRRQPADPVGLWVNALQGMHAGDQPRDITEALRRAMASGAATIYLPYGRYTISDAITVPPTVRRIVGMNAVDHGQSRA